MLFILEAENLQLRHLPKRQPPATASQTKIYA